MALTDTNYKLFPFQENLMGQLAEIKPIAEELIQMGYSTIDRANSWLFYVPYISLFVTSAVNVSDFKPKTHEIKGYNDIYSDIKERFRLLDL